MASVKRRINSTGRKKITRDHIDIRLREAKPGEPLQANIDLTLVSLGLPKDAEIVIEPYYRASSMRFDCGTIGNPAVPDVLELREIDKGGNVLFRVKVVDNVGDVGKILAQANGLRPLNLEESKDRRSLFPVRLQDLGPEIWKVEVDSVAGPVLLLNNRIPAAGHRLVSNPFFSGAILPAALRQVLISLVNDLTEDDDGDSWQHNWVQYCADIGVSDDPFSFTEEDDKVAWMDAVVQRFCEQFEFIKLIRQEIAGEDTSGE